MMLRKNRLLFIAIMLVILLTTPLGALQYSGFVEKTLAEVKPAIETDEIESFLDGVIESQLEIYHIPGASVSVVQDGKVILAKGYGYGNVEKRIPVSADRTLFRTGSVSKLFVWTAVMQLVEQGKLELSSDVNLYLEDFKIPQTYSKPITIADLMNHTTGFEERAIKESVESVEDIRPLGEYLAAHMPARVRPPGEITAYSNYGASLAGYIVSEISGMSFEEYVEKNILNPLNMGNSTFRQPLPKHLAPNLAIGYTFQNGAYKAQDFEWKQSSPAGSQSASAADMANFMIAHLQGGRLADQSILQEATARTMHKQIFTNDPRVNGIAHGFMEANVNNQRILFHGGDIFHFHTMLALIPEHNIGIYVAYNGASAAKAGLDTLKAFMNHYYPVGSSEKNSLGIKEDITKYKGTYMPARHEYTTSGKMVGLFSSINIEPEGEDQIKVSFGFPAQLTSHYYPYDLAAFKPAGIQPPIYGDIVLRKDPISGTEYLFIGNNPTTAYIKLPWYGSPVLNLLILVVCLLVFIWIILWAPFNMWTQQRRSKQLPIKARYVKWLFTLISVLSILFIFGFLSIFSSQKVVFGLPGWSNVLALLPALISAALIAAVVLLVLFWKKDLWSMKRKLFYIIATTFSAVFIWWLVYWNLWYLRI